ncbi:MAG TPA: hypothetical protein VML75_08495 [Kofleriaceae bacterium]|nr:hypothetical protein [Kofleriaceae bacterium]
MRHAPILILLSAACGSSQKGPSPAEQAASLDLDSAPAPAAAELAELTPSNARTSCYFGDLFVTPAGKAESAQGALLVKLILDQDRNQIVEDTWSFPLYERYVITRVVTGDRFTMTQDDGAFAGTGSLQGEPWVWRSWTTRASSADAQIIVETDTRFHDGSLVTSERVLGADGGMRVAVRHSLDEIPLEE